MKEKEPGSAKIIFQAFLAKMARDDLPTQSAALAYYALLSLAPLSVGALLIWSFFPLPSSQDLLALINQWLGPQAAEAIQFVRAQTEQPNNSRVWTGVLTILSILIFGTAVFSQLQSSLDRIWQRSSSLVGGWFIQRFLSMLLFFGALSILFIYSMVVIILSAFEQKTGVLVGPILRFMMPLLFAAGLCGIYRWFSRRIIPWPAALQAGIITSLLFELGNFLFQIYVKKAAIGSAYGTAGALVIFPLWVFYSSLIFLVGAELAFLLKEIQYPKPARISK